ncbi:MAG: TetR/AcrR family transcriptional regulator [Terriglobales bacterium]
MTTSNTALPGNVFPADTRYDRRLAEILQHATAVFCEKGYDAASMRDLSRATGMSLAGLYYYFESKEKLLYLIQKHTFQTIIDRLQQRLSEVSDPEQQVREIIRNHLDYFLANKQGMKVITHESGLLNPALEQEVRAIRRQYYMTVRGVIDALKTARRLDISARLATLGLFGMMNWIYTWHNPKVDADADELARSMGDLFLNGFLGTAKSKQDTRPAAAPSKPAARKKRSASS